MDADAAFGASYTRGQDVRWVRDFRFASVAEPFTAQIMGETSLEVSVEPKIEFLVYGLAGLSAGVTPSGRGIFQAGTATPLTGRLEADVSLALGLDGPAFEAIHFTPELSWTVWEDEWQLFPKEPVITFRQQLQSQTVTVGDSAYFACAVTTSETPRYQWVHDGIPLPGQTSRTLLLPNVTYRHAGGYWVEVSAGAAKAKSDRAVLTVTSGTPAPSGMVWIPPGTFTMGSPSSERNRGSDEGPQTVVTISRGFWLGKYEVTQREYLAVTGSNPSLFKVDLDRPVEQVRWYEAVEYCNRLTQQERAAGRLPAGYEYRLPTEAQWEYACRAGTTTRFSFGDALECGDECGTCAIANRYMWWCGNSEDQTHRVGQKLPNPWGLYDMHGNVWEWCADWYSSSYPGGSVTDPQGPTSGSYRVCRGGIWNGNGLDCRSANRFGYWPVSWNHNLGFRAALVPVP